MRISDWSSDVCSSDLVERVARAYRRREQVLAGLQATRLAGELGGDREQHRLADHPGVRQLVRDLLEPGAARHHHGIGRAACRERVCQYVSISVGAVSLKKKTTTQRQ